MTSLIRKSLTGAVGALGLAAMLAASATPASAQWRGHRYGGGWGPGIAAGVIGGFAIGALAAGANRGYAYGPPVYAEPQPYYPAVGYADQGYAPICHKEWRPQFRADGEYIRDRLVRVCN